MNPAVKAASVVLVACLCTLAFGRADAALIDRGGGLIYDTDLDITWLQDANYYGVRMNWDDAVAWAAGLNFGGYDDWRLPKVGPANGSAFVYGDLSSAPSNSYSYSGLTDLGFNVANPHTELGYMFCMNLGNTGYYDTTGTCSRDTTT
jgi:hypothetical protein